MLEDFQEQIKKQISSSTTQQPGAEQRPNQVLPSLQQETSAVTTRSVQSDATEPEIELELTDFAVTLKGDMVRASWAPSDGGVHDLLSLHERQPDGKNGVLVEATKAVRDDVLVEGTTAVVFSLLSKRGERTDFRIRMPGCLLYTSDAADDM
eukprot:4801327-Prymnesium_polylepis.1